MTAAAIFLIGLFGLILIVCLYVIANLTKKIEAHEEYFVQLQSGLTHVIQEMHRIDLSGAFASEDEVGITFKALKAMVESLQQYMTPAE